MSNSHDADSPEVINSMLSRKSHRWLPVTAVVLLALAGGGLYVLGALPKIEARAAAAERAAKLTSSPRKVQVVPVRQAAETFVIKQSATLQPQRRAQILAQVAGYLVERKVEIGDVVQEGQVLGVVATPMLEKELSQVESQRAAALAEITTTEQQLDFAKRTSGRLNKAVESKAAAQQDVDAAETQVQQATSSSERATALLQATEAQIERLRRLLSFRELRAPFAGTVTRRNREQGDFIEVGGKPTDPSVFTVVDSSSLRTVVDIPQSQAYLIRVGQSAKVRVGGVGDLVIEGKVTRISGEIDQLTRTMPVELLVPNTDGRLIAGSFATVEIETKRTMEQRPALIPGNALMSLPTQPDGSGGPTVAVVTGAAAPYSLTYRSVKLGRDFGNDIEVLSGLTTNDRVAVNLSIPLAAGTRIEPVNPAITVASPAASASVTAASVPSGAAGGTTGAPAPTITPGVVPGVAPAGAPAAR